QRDSSSVHAISQSGNNDPADRLGKQDRRQRQKSPQDERSEDSCCDFVHASHSTRIEAEGERTRPRRPARGVHESLVNKTSKPWLQRRAPGLPVGPTPATRS